MNHSRTILALAALALALPVAAQSTERPKPPGTVPLEEAPPPPPMPDAIDEDKDPRIQPQVTTRVEGEQTVQEYRLAGKLYMIRVQPKHGIAYVLVDHKGDGTFTRQDNTLDQRVRVPQWLLLEF